MEFFGFGDRGIFEHCCGEEIPVWTMAVRIWAPLEVELSVSVYFETYLSWFAPFEQELWVETLLEC